MEITILDLFFDVFVIGPGLLFFIFFILSCIGCLLTIIVDRIQYILNCKKEKKRYEAPYKHFLRDVMISEMRRKQNKKKEEKENERGRQMIVVDYVDKSKK